MVSLLPATATVIGDVVLVQIPSLLEVAGVALVVVGVGLHRESATTNGPAGGSTRSARPGRRSP